MKSKPKLFTDEMHKGIFLFSEGAIRDRGCSKADEIKGEQTVHKFRSVNSRSKIKKNIHKTSFGLR